MNRVTELPPVPARDPQGHKGTFGTVAVVGGSAAHEARMIGAPALAAMSALRAGAGLARLVMPEPILSHGMTISPWATGIAIPVERSGQIIGHESAALIDRLAASSTCLAIGPGLGRGDGPRAATLRAIQQEEAPVVVDADALNSMSELPDLARDFHAAAVLTPHPGEFRRLTEGMGLGEHLGLSESREGAASALAQRLGCVVVLKGAHTVVSDGDRVWVNDTVCDCLATAGTGDVLTGLIAGLIAQFVHLPPGPPLPAAAAPRPPGRPLDLFGAACLGVHVHGLSGIAWTRSRKAGAGMLATELADQIPAVLESLRARGG